MTKAFKNILMHINDYSTYDFKRGIAKIKAARLTDFSFSWDADTRLSDAVYRERIKKILPALFNTSSENFEYTPVPHGVVVTLKEV